MTPTIPQAPLETAYWVAESVRVVAEYADYLMGEVAARGELERLKWELKLRESEPWCLTQDVDGKTVPLLNGSNEPARTAQFVRWCGNDGIYLRLRVELDEAEREHRLAVAQVEASRERVRTARAIVLALAPDRGMG